MAGSSSYIAYSSEAYYESAHVFMEGNNTRALLEKIRELGARRVMFLCAEELYEFKNIENLLNDYEKFGFRCFPFKRKSGLLKDTDIEDALTMYREYNCDTIVTVGGLSEVDCGKIVSAMHTNGFKSPTELVGVNSFKRDMSLVCCIVTDCSSNASTPAAEFMDTLHNRWCVSYSSYLLPQIVVFDSEICMRKEVFESVDGALTSLCIAIESYISPVAHFATEFRANALLSIQSILNNVDRVVNSQDDSYLRRKLACGGFYAGLACTRTGFGHSHLIVHALLERYGDVHGVMYVRILSEYLKIMFDTYKAGMSKLSHALHLCSDGVSEEDSAQALILSLERFVTKYSQFTFNPMLSASDARKIGDEVRKAANDFELPKLPNGTIALIFANKEPEK